MVHTVQCPICHSSDNFQVGTGRGRKCRECGNGWVARELPLPTPGRPLGKVGGPSSTSRAAAGLDGLARLQALPMAEKVRHALRVYLEVALVDDRDEGDAWTMRALPSTKAIKHRRRLFTVNVSNMEVLVAHYDPQVREESGGFMVVDGKRRAALARAVGERAMEPSPYRTSSAALVIRFSDLDDMLRLLSKPVVRDATRDLNDGLRARAQVPSLQRQWHVPEFVAWIRDG